MFRDIRLAGVDMKSDADYPEIDDARYKYPHNSRQLGIMDELTDWGKS